MDRRITLRYPVQNRDASGAAVEAWLNAASVWANWTPAGGREFNAALSRNPEITGAFRIRYRAGVDSTYRVLFSGVLYEVVAVLEVGRRSYLDLMVKTSSMIEGTSGSGIQP